MRGMPGVAGQVLTALEFGQQHHIGGPFRVLDIQTHLQMLDLWDGRRKSLQADFHSLSIVCLRCVTCVSLQAPHDDVLNHRVMAYSPFTAATRNTRRRLHPRKKAWDFDSTSFMVDQLSRGAHDTGELDWG